MNPIEKYPGLQPLFKTMENHKHEAPLLAKEVLDYTEGEYYLIHFLLLAILDRTANVLDGITDAIMKWNVIVAGSLLRNLLDTLAVLVFLSEQQYPPEAINALFKDGRLMRRKGMKLKRIPDAEIIEHTKKVYPWAKDVYGETSGFVHFSGKHLFGIVQKISNKDRVITMKVGVGQESWPEEELKNFLEVTNTITCQIFQECRDFTSIIEK